MLKFHAGSSSTPDTARAAVQALRSALEGTAAHDVRLVVFHVTMGHDPGSALKAIRTECPGARVVGCSVAGVIGRDGANEALRALALMAVSGDENEVSVTHIDGFTGATSRNLAASLARTLQESSPALRSAMLIAPGIDVAMDEAIAGIESVLGADLPIFGGTASDNMKGIATYQCVDDTVYQQGAFLIGFSDPTLEFHSTVTHGFVAAGVELEVTSSTGNRVHTLDGKPAWAAYTHALGLPETATPGDTIPPGAVGVKLPKALAQECGDSHILRVITHREPDGSFILPVTCPVGTRLSLMRRDEERIFANLATRMTELVERTGGQRPVAVFQTDCGARGRLMLDRVSKEEIVADMQRPLFGAETGPWLGMYGFGEITQLGGRNMFHNYTTSLYVFTRRQA
jgi:hypothetical protein